MNRVFQVLLVLISQQGCIYASEIFADSHIHFNWDHRAATSPEEVVEILKQHNVGLTIVAGTPSELALELREKGGDWIIPFFSPYIHELGKRDWYMDEQVVKNAEQGLKNGQYHGIGEVHFMNGFKPRTDNRIFLQLIKLEEEYDYHWAWLNDLPVDVRKKISWQNTQTLLKR